MIHCDLFKVLRKLNVVYPSKLLILILHAPVKNLSVRTSHHHGSQSWIVLGITDHLVSRNKEHAIVDLLKLAQAINKTQYVGPVETPTTTTRNQG